MKDTKFDIPLTKPYITLYMKDFVMQILESGFLTEGKFNKKFEQSISAYCKVKDAISVPNATIGLELALNCLGKKGSEVIIPSFTHPATALAIAHAEMIPVIIDINPSTMLIDYNRINDAISDKTSIIMPVSIFGNPIDYSELFQFNKTKYIVEDAACSIGSSYNEIMTGSLADVSVFSFHPRKTLTTGEGGMIVTNNTTVNSSIRCTKNFGYLKTQTDFIANGSNYKLSDIQASLGYAQMQILDEMITKRIKLANIYNKAFKDIPEITVQETTKGGIHSYQTYCILIEHRDTIMRQLRDIGIEVQVGSYAIHRCKTFLYDSKAIVYGYMKNTNLVVAQALALPLYVEMTKVDQQIVIEELLKAINKTKG